MTINDVRVPLLALLANNGIDPEASDASIAFFNEQLAPFAADEQERALRHVSDHLAEWFVSLAETRNPGWLQGFDWPFTADCRPLVYVGAIRVPEQARLLATSVFFVFWNSEVDETVTVRQSVF